MCFALFANSGITIAFGAAQWRLNNASGGGVGGPVLAGIHIGGIRCLSSHRQVAGILPARKFDSHDPEFFLAPSIRSGGCRRFTGITGASGIDCTFAVDHHVAADITADFF
jgi:hypothetical protein